MLLKNALFSQAGFGITANTILLLSHILPSLQDCRLKPSSLTICHLALVHIVMLLTMVFLVSPDLFESLHFQNDFKCKALYYVSRVMQGLSICTTCVLSTLQAITLSPSTSWLAQFKHKSVNFITHVYVFMWTLSLSSCASLTFYVVAFSNLNQTHFLKLDKYCSLSPMNSIVRYLFYALTTSRDVCFVGVMLISSMYLLNLLFKHQKRVQYLHSSSRSSTPSPEKRASQTIVLLVGFFVVMFWMDFIISSFPTHLSDDGPVMQTIRTLVSKIYAIVSPVVLLSSDRRVIGILQSVKQACSSLSH
ncbi:putative vomeronasal receptor-like protein 4 [Ochotona curzoniae]|uniref:putative vomeronasal receptor-like protein 4 n=1 Tax=Ochotona curzoniae TaxID=130825 RepID=UPI001B34F1F2|nr:putative vomeronasal receptor-like protein 4 [Ochotona curzoniae]